VPERIEFLKGHGTENDFVVLPDVERRLELSARLVAAICDRRAGLGADGVLRVVPAAGEPAVAHLAGEAPWFMDHRNADGSLAEMCGNGIRLFARYLVDAGLAGAGTLRIATRDGVKQVTVHDGGAITVGMGRRARVEDRDGVRVAVGGRSWAAVAVDLGNPHAVVAVPDLPAAGDLRTPPTVTPAAAYPGGVNVEFVEQRGPERIAMRVHERGVGETRSCGTGACAAAAVAARSAGAEGAWTRQVDVPGGSLTVEQRPDGELTLTGPAVFVARGELCVDWVDRHR